MSLNLRYPNITGFTEKEQLAQIKSFLHQLVNELNFVPIGDSSGQGASYEVQGGTVSYYELQSLIIQQIQKMDRDFEQLSTKLVSEVDSYVDEAFGGSVAEAVSETLPQAISDELGLVVQDGMLCTTYTEVANE